MKHFGTVSSDEVKQNHIKYTPDNTIKMNKIASELLRTYFKEKDRNPNFAKFTDEELADVPSTFYLDARTNSGAKYKTITLENVRHSLNRYLRSLPVSRDIDIITAIAFRNANESLKTSMRELKQRGKGSADHYPQITDNDLMKMYMSLQMNPTTPTDLLKRNQMDIRLYFCRQAHENM